MTGAVIWDFDGTLGFRLPLREGDVRSDFSTCLIEGLDAFIPGHDIEPTDLRPYLAQGFPWHSTKPHPELRDPDRWWMHVCGLLRDALERVGVSQPSASTIAARVRARYVDPARWRLYDDALPALSSLSAMGWRHVVLSNHVPELPAIAVALRLGEHVDTVLSSALTGYEKPHPESFGLALRAAGSPDRRWVVGDNLVADVQGAQAAGIPAILVRRPGVEVHRSAVGLLEAATIIEDDLPSEEGGG